MAEILSAIDAWPVAVYFSRSSVAYALLNAAHILSLCLLVGAVVTLDITVLGGFRGVPIHHLAPPLERVAGAGLAAAIVTGALLFTVRPAAYAANPAFLAKLALVVAGIANALAARHSRSWRIMLRGGGRSGGLVLSAILSLAIWVSAVVAGRAIGFLQ